MLMIRLQRTGRNHEPTFRVVLTDSKNGPKSGKYLENLGWYDTRIKNKIDQMDTEKIKHWLSHGAKLSLTLHNYLVETEKGERQPLPTKEFLFWSDVARVAAESTLKKLNKKRQLTIRINEKDLMLLKVKSSELGMPYQTLLQSIIHQYVTKKE